MSTSITACPKALHAEAVETVIRPVTQVDVAAVNKASIYGIAFPLFELMGRESSRLPQSTAAAKPSSIICVVDRRKRIFSFML